MEKSKCSTLEKTAIILTCLAAAIGIAAFILPPPWQVHESVIKLIGEFIGLIAILFAWASVKRGMDVKLTHGKTSIDLNNPDGNEQKTDE